MTPSQQAIYSADPALFLAEKLGLSTDPHQRDLLLSDPHRCILNCTRQWGKSSITAAKAVHRAFFSPESLTLVLSPSARQSSEFLRKASAFLRKLALKPRRDGDNEISLLLPNRSRIVGLPGKESTIRGFSSVSLLLIDEAARVPDELYSAVTPMLAVSDGQLWLMSTPNGKRGFFYETWIRNNPEWRLLSIPANECSRISPAFLERERKNLPDHTYRQEYLCEFLDADDALFTSHHLENLLSHDIRPLFSF